MTRENRAEAVRTERRRTAGSIENTGMKMVFDEKLLDRKNYAYRMVNDTKGRIRTLESQDWDIAPEAALVSNTGVGTAQSVHGGVNELGAFNVVLMRKPLDMHKEDQAAKQKPLDEIDARINQGTLRADAGMAGDGTYTPGSGNQINRI